MAFDLVSAYAASDAPFYVSGQNAPTLTASPQQITLRFSPGVKIDAATLSSSITVVRSGGVGDAFGNPSDVNITPGHIAVDDLPNENQVVIRFAETLPDDSYRISIGGGLKTVAEGSSPAEQFRNGSAFNLDFRLDLGAFVVSVVPQPVSRSGGALSQDRNAIVVYFNSEDPLKKSSAETKTSYRLFEVDASTGVETLVAANSGNPTNVSYDAATGKAVLTFAAGTIADNKLYRLQIGGADALVPAAAPVTEGSDGNSSFATAKNLGLLTAAGATVNGAINVRPNVPTPVGALDFPGQVGSVDMPGNRDIPTDSGASGNAALTTGPAAAVVVQNYNFQDIYGEDPQGNPLRNAITEAQKQRAREVFELFSRYTGIRFVETATSGLTVATGDPRAADPTIPPMAVGGIAGVAAIMNSNLDWGASEYGGAWFTVAMHEIGHVLGLGHTYDLPSIMGKGLPGEPVFPGDYDIQQMNQLYPANGSDIDVYSFTLGVAGKLSAETIVGRPGQQALSTLDSVLTLYREVGGKRELIARNDDYYGRDSFVGLDLVAGVYFLAVTSTGNTAFNPEVSDSGYGGRSDGAYQLKLGFQPASVAATTIVDASDTLLDGDRDGKPGGAFSFWFNTASIANTIFVDKLAAAGGNGSIASPFNTIKAAVDGVGAKKIIRVVGNPSNTPYLIGTTLQGAPLADGATFNVPKGVTVMIDAGAVFKLRAAVIDVGSASPIVSRAGAAIQVLGTPGSNVTFTSYHDDSIGGNSDGVGPAVAGGQWGGIVLRSDSDAASKKSFVNVVSQATITYGGGQVLVDSKLGTYAPIQLESTRPTIAYNTITKSAGAAIAADPNSFEDSNNRLGPAIRGNKLVDNSVNGLFINIRTALGSPVDRLDVPARFTATDIVYVLQENLFINGGVGGYDSTSGVLKARQSGRLTIDPGVVVKLQGARIELERGVAQLIAEGTAGQPVVFTSLGDTRFGAGGTFDTNGNALNDRAPGDWGGIVLDAGSKASIDHAYIAYAGGQTPIEGGFDQFNAIEVHQGDLRLAHSRIENNAAGTATTNRTGRGGNVASTVFVRGAQPVILGNDFRDNAGAVVSINANALTDAARPDAGRSTGGIGRDARYDDNAGPLIRDNRLSYAKGVSAVAGLQVRGEEITVESVWDDVDIVHVLQNEIIVQNFHATTGVRLTSRPDASLIVKLAGADAGFTAAGYGLDIDDRIGGTVQVVGQPGYPVILTSLHDDTVGASLDPLGRPTTDTNVDGDSKGSAGDWRSLKFLPLSNDRNVSVVLEVEGAATGGNDTNASTTTAQALGTLAPNFATGANTWESAQEKTGDDNRRLGFEVHGRIANDFSGDVDVYSFTAYAGSEVWIDIDKTEAALDSMVELLDAAGNVLARSADSLSDAALSASVRGAGADLRKDAFRGGDFYSINPKDAGMRVILPVAGQPIGTQAQYYVRVRSQPRYDAVTTKPQYEVDLADPSKLDSGATSGRYELRIRLRQQDEKPGSTVRYADIRYPTIGVDVQGLPNHSPLTGETGENSTDTNNAYGSAQYVGNLLQSDRNTISIAGALSSQEDVDWYTFALNYEQIQAISGVNGGTKTWSTVFDLDYADGFRGDLTLSVFDASGKLIYVGRDSNVKSDQPGDGQGVDTDDLSRGSLGKLDPFIGSVQLPAGNPTGSADVESGAAAVPVDPSKQLRYYVAVSSNEKLPTALNAMFKGDSTNTLIRLEPVNSVKRIAEDHIGFTGYATGTKDSSANVAPATGPLIDIGKLSTHVTPFTLSDVTLFVSSGSSLVTVDAMRGGIESTLVSKDFGGGDLVMRSDGRLYAYSGVKDGVNLAGRLDIVDSGTGVRTLYGNDAIPDPPAGGGTPAPGAINTDNVDAVAWQRTDVGEYKNLYYSVREGSKSRLYQADPANGSAAFVDKKPWGLKGVIQDANNRLGVVTGMAFVDGRLYGVDTRGFLFRIDVGSGLATIIDLDSSTPGTADPLAGVSFGGLAIGPQNLYGGALKNALFAIDAAGRLRAFDTAGAALKIFDGDGDGIPDATSIGTGAFGATGLAFSPLDVNLWHPTLRRGGDAGHGVNNAPDASRTGQSEKVYWGYKGGLAYGSEASGAQSMYFGLQKYSAGPFTDFYADAAGGQYGGAAAWHADLSTNPDIVDNYNLPGGAYGSLTTNAFSLAGYDSSDKPTLYFNYWLQTQDASSSFRNENMRDSARAFVSTDQGLTWELVATNNSSRSEINTSNGELPAFASVSAKAASSTIDNQHVQELYDTSNWRQARIDLGKYAGQADLRLRFDFSTAGEMDRDQSRAVSTLLTAAATSTTTVVVATVEGLVPGMKVVAAGVDPSTTIVSVDAGAKSVELSSPVTLLLGESIGFSAKLNDIKGYANSLGKFSGDGAAQRGQSNEFEGFYIDDIIVGLAERGEMVTGSQSGQTDFFSVGTPVGQPTVPAQSLQGPYQLEIRRGTEYGSQIAKTKSDILLTGLSDSNDDLVAANGGRGDANLLREQGQFLIENNIVRDAKTYGISIEAGVRDAGTQAPATGVVRNLPVLNGSRLVPGVVVTNNVLAASGTAGILFSGDANAGNVPTAAVPYGRIVNNTFYGGATAKGVGVAVTENAGPTLLNNVFASLATGVSVDASSQSRTVVGTSAYYKTATQLAGGTQSQPVVLDGNPFVKELTGNFYLAAGSKAIDSALNSLPDRNELVAVTSPLGISQSPIIAPDRDLYGQLRGDDPGQASLAGLGSNTFKDRGAVDRVDFTQPSLALLQPLDGSKTAPVDRDPSVDAVRIEGAAARSLTQFVLQLGDIGVGIDNATVVKSAFSVRRDGQTLVEGLDYLFRYFENNKRVVFESAAVFATGQYTIEVAQTPSKANVIADLAGNTLLPNKPDGKTSFTIALADVPAAPGSVVATADDGRASVTWTAPAANGSAITDFVVQYSSNNGVSWTTFADGTSTTTSATVTGLANGTSYRFRVAAVNAVGQGDFSAVSAAVVPFARATAPTGLVAVAADGRATLTWGLPATMGSGTLQDYLVEYRPITDATWKRFSDGVGTGGSATVTPLTNGTSYVFRVAAVTSVGEGLWSAASAQVTPLGPPTAPLSLVGTAGDGRAILSWSAPAANGGSNILDYVVQWSANSGGSWTSFADGTSAATGATVTGLTNGTTYVFRVAAVTNAGQGAWSAVSSAVVPAGPASAPRNLVASAGNAQAVLSWAAPASTGGSAVRDYVVQVSSDGGKGWTVFADGTSATPGATVTGLSYGATYLFRVAAVTSVGQGAWTAGASVQIPLATPSAVTRLEALPGNGLVALKWLAPSSSGTLPIVNYIVEYKTQSAAIWLTLNRPASAGLSAAVSGLANGVGYVFRVRAVNGNGSGPAVQTTEAVVPMLPPTQVTGRAGNGSVALTWLPPRVSPTGGIIDYRVQYSSDGGATWTTAADGISAASRTTVRGLRNGVSYVFRVAAVTRSGVGTYSANSIRLTPRAV